ncbi:DUF3990 domain-containing protein [Patescibacteria group bacterium]|nr:DUF3990 domain-containing protein [Patescibacteria group bacterium]
MVDISAELSPHPDYSIRGDVVLGVRDPRTMNEAEFRSSPNLLYHGAAQEFTYSPTGDFDPNNTGGDGTHDYGGGFYSTDDLSQARNYSLVRSFGKRSVVYTLLPYQARMLDVRALNDFSSNGALPKNFVEGWLVYLENFVNDENNFSTYSQFLKETFQEGIKDYFLDRVKKALEGNKPINIRGGDHPNSTGIFQKTKNGLISHIFRDFMLSKGYDGMIYREGGEGKDAKALTGYVFYNSRVIDTWEGWQKRKE